MKYYQNYQKYDQNESKFNGVFREIIYLINLGENQLVGTHWIALYANGDNLTYFDSFEVEYIPKEITKFIGTKKLQEI